MNRCIKYFTCAGLVLGLFLHPAYSASETISLDDAVRRALDNNREYKIAQLKAKEADEQVNMAWSQLMPLVESEASLTRQYADKGFMSLSDGQVDIKVVQLRFIINPGVFYNNLQVARNAYIVATEEMRRIRNEIVFNVIKGYFDYLFCGEIVALRKEAIDMYTSNLRDVENMYKKGSVPKFELLQAQVELKNQEPALLEAENNRRTALEIFNYLLGFDDNKYEPDRAILDVEVRSVSDADADARIERLVMLALKNRPEVMQVTKKGEIAEDAAERDSSYYLWPTFSVSGYYGYSQADPVTMDLPIDMSQITGDDQWQETWQVRIAATYRWNSLLPFDSTRDSGRTEELKAGEAREELARIKRVISISVKASYNKLFTSYLTIQSQKDNVKTAEEGLRIARESYRAGLIKNSDLLSAQLGLTTARTGYINALYTYYVSLAALKKETCTEDDSVILEGK